MADVNNDGYLDIYVSRNGESMKPEERKNQLYINNQDLTFNESAMQYGLADAGFSSQAVFFDMDNDGDLDMYQANQPPDARLFKRYINIPKERYKFYTDKLYKNENGKYVDASNTTKISKTLAYGLSVNASDFNNDGWTDLYVANDYDEPDFMYYNNGDGTFTNVINNTLKHISRFSMGTDTGDINNDGFMDLVTLDMAAEDHYRSKINMNSMKEAWFEETTNFDLAAIRWTYEKAAEMALELGKEEEAKRWEMLLQEWPDFVVHKSEGLMFAPGHRYEESHRHFSHLMAFHPFGLIDYSKGEAHKKIIDNTINHLVETGSDYFTGYSFSWLANLQARAFDGEAAAKTLRIFAENFCLPNTFHVNGEQHNKGYSKFKYRPFTLEGNFAFASAIQEMLIQSHTGVVHIFPAIPEDWLDASFNTLRTEGAFLVSAKKENGLVQQVNILSEKGGILKLKNPFGSSKFEINSEYILKNDIIQINTSANQNISIILKYQE